MAIKLKTGKTFNPSISTHYGVDMTTGVYHGVIDSIEYNKKDKECRFSVNIYSSEASRIADGNVVDRINFNFNGSTFDSDIGNDGLTIPAAYVKVLETLTDWVTDEVI